MKKTLLLGLVVILFIACQQVKPERYTTKSPEIDSYKVLLKDYQDGNWENWITHYSDTAKIYHNSIESMTPQQLRDGFIESLSNFSSYGFFDEDTTFFEMILDDENETWVYFWGNWEGKINVTNKELVVPIHIALQFVDGKIVEEYAFYDMSSINAARNEKEAAEDMPEEEEEEEV